MSHYSVSFTISSDAGYDRRYDSLVAQIRRQPGRYVWEETTSFALVETTETLQAFAERLYLHSEFSKIRDKLLVVDHLNSNAIAYGQFDYPSTLKGHFRSCQIVS